MRFSCGCREARLRVCSTQEQHIAVRVIHQLRLYTGHVDDFVKRYLVKSGAMMADQPSVSG